MSVFNRMTHLQHDDFYFVLPSHARSEGVHDNRPQHFKVDLPKELFLEGAWEVGVSELLYTHTFYEPPRFTLTADDRTLSVSNGARLGDAGSTPDQNAPLATLGTETGVCGSYHWAGSLQGGELLYGCTVHW